MFKFGLLLIFASVYWAQELIETRVSVVFLGTDWTDDALIFRSSSGSLYWTLAHRYNNNDVTGTIWQNIALPSGIKCYSNPVSVEQPGNTTFLFFQNTNGQVYMNKINHAATEPKFGDWTQVGGNLAFDEGSDIKGYDSISAQNFEGKIYVFARSFSNSSHLYWSSMDPSKELSSAWSMIGGSSVKLLTDAAVAYNSFTTLMELFMVSTDGHLYRSWQISFGKWSSWDKTGYYAPSTLHAPVVHSMDTNIFNGRLNVFLHGTDGNLHHIWQTTCDKVPNPWGWCTWSTWETIGDDIPITAASVTNTLSIGNNIHLGIELFVVDVHGKLYKMWQSKRHGSWSVWELVAMTTGHQIATLPAIVNDGTGWWSAYTLDTTADLLIVKQNRSFSASPSSVTSGGIVIASWDMPVDEASNSDWIGIYPRGTSNHFYVDYMYVGGTQNPMSEVIPSGKVSFTTYLPRGTYDLRYLVNKRFVAAVGTSLLVSGGSQDVEWVQVFAGIFTGLNIKHVSVKTCVKDAESIPQAFQDAFRSFEDREIFTGLKKLGEAVDYIVKGMHDCSIEKTLINRVVVFVKDLISCIKGSCVHFLVDFGKEVLVLYENIYEIYGDIIGASNSFKIKAYVQGGVNIGRVIGGCISLPR